MSWAIGYSDEHRRDIGYGVPALCDHPDCNERIHRGLSYVCGGEPYGGEWGCGLHFCTKHLAHYDRDPTITPQLCERCGNEESRFEAKPDIKEWIDWKLTDPSWAEWRAEHPEFVAAQSAIDCTNVVAEKS